MKKILVILLLFLIIFSTSACGSKEVSGEPINYRDAPNLLSYDVPMVLNHSFLIGMMNFDHVLITAAEGTVINAVIDNGDVTVKGDGTNQLTIDLVGITANVRIFLSACAEGNCPVIVHFLHTTSP